MAKQCHDHPPPTVHEPIGEAISVIGSQYLAPHPVDLTVTAKSFSFSGGDYAVTDINGKVVFNFKGKILSLRDRRYLLDPAGNTLITMRQKMMTAHHRWKAFRGDSTDDKDLLFTVKKSSVFQLRDPKLEVFFATNTREKVCDLKIKGSCFERSGTVVAQMRRGCSAKNLVSGNDGIVVTVYPNVDYAFIISLVVILDEINDGKESRDQLVSTTLKISSNLLIN